MSRGGLTIVGDGRLRAYVNQQIAVLVDTAPAALDKLSEIAAAINNDPNFGSDMLAFAAATVTSLSDKVSLSGSYSNPAWIADLTASKITGTLSNAQLANSAVTIGSTAVSLGATVTTIAGLSSVTSTAFVGALTGNVTGNVTGSISGGTVAGSTGTFSNQVYSTGANTAHGASRVMMEQESSTLSVLTAYGPNGATNGTVAFRSRRSDGSNSIQVWAYDGSTFAITPAVTMAAGATINGSSGLSVTNGNAGLITLGSVTYYGTIQHDAAVTGSMLYNIAAASGGGHIFRVGGTDKVTIAASGAVTMASTLSSGTITVTGRYLTDSSQSISGSAVAAVYNNHASGYGMLVRGGNGANYTARWEKYDGSTAMEYSSSNLAIIGTLGVSGHGTHKFGNADTGDVTLQIGPDTPGAARSGRIAFLSTNAQKNWFVGANWLAGGRIDFAPSTTVGGNVMGSAAFTITDTGNITAAGNAVIGGTLSATSTITTSGGFDSRLAWNDGTNTALRTPVSNPGGNIYFQKGDVSASYGYIGPSGLYTNKLNLSALPTSSAGLSSGDLWNDSGTVKIV